MSDNVKVEDLPQDDTIVYPLTQRELALLTDRQLLEGIYLELIELNHLRHKIETHVPPALEQLGNNPLLGGIARMLGGAFK